MFMGTNWRSRYILILCIILLLGTVVTISAMLAEIIMIKHIQYIYIYHLYYYSLFQKTIYRCQNRFIYIIIIAISWSHLFYLHLYIYIYIHIYTCTLMWMPNYCLYWKKLVLDIGACFQGSSGNFCVCSSGGLMMGFLIWFMQIKSTEIIQIGRKCSISQSKSATAL